MKREYHMKRSVASSHAIYDAMPVGLSVDELTAYYSSFHTIGLAAQCQILKNKIEALKGYNQDDQLLQSREAKRRLRIARSILANRQMKLF
jgi:hypothetical protein